MTKLAKLILNAQKLKARMTTLKNKPDVRAYFKAEAERKAIHATISEHIGKYAVNIEEYEKMGLVESNKTWVKVAEVVELTTVFPEFRKVLLKLIHSKQSYYTK